jgi:hypothetical protein
LIAQFLQFHGKIPEFSNGLFQIQIWANPLHIQVGNWVLLFQVTPFLGVCCVVLILFIVKEPVRGAADGGEHLHNTSFFTDLKELVKKYVFYIDKLIS